MPRRDRFDSDVILGLQREVKELRQKVARHEPYTSVPIYDPRNPPPNLIEGTLFYHITDEKLVVVRKGILRRTDQTNAPSGSAQSNSNIAAPTGAATTLSYNFSSENEYGVFDSSLDDQKLTVVEDGVYLITACVEFDTPVGQSGICGVFVRKNNLIDIVKDQRYLPDGIGPIIINLAWQQYFIATDYIKLSVYHTLTISLDIMANDYSPVLRMVKVADTDITPPIIFN